MNSTMATESIRTADTHDKNRMARRHNKNQQAEAAGQKSRQRVLDFFAECLTSPANPTTVDQLNEFKMTSYYFPILREAIDKVERSFADTEDLRRAIMLAAAYDIIERLISLSAARLTWRTDPQCLECRHSEAAT